MVGFVYLDLQIYIETTKYKYKLYFNKNQQT